MSLSSPLGVNLALQCNLKILNIWCGCCCFVKVWYCSVSNNPGIVIGRIKLFEKVVIAGGIENKKHRLLKYIVKPRTSFYQWSSWGCTFSLGQKGAKETG